MLEIALVVLWDFIHTDTHTNTQLHRHTGTDTHTHTPRVYSQKVTGKPSNLQTSVGLLLQPLMLPSVQYISSSLQMLENVNVCRFRTPSSPASKLNMCFFFPLGFYFASHFCCFPRPTQCLSPQFRTCNSVHEVINIPDTAPQHLPSLGSP